MGNDMSKTFQVLLIGFIASLILSALFVGLRSSALTSAYDNAQAFEVNDTAGVSHVVPASPISADTTALFWALMAGLVWLIYVIGAVFILIKQVGK